MQQNWRSCCETSETAGTKNIHGGDFYTTTATFVASLNISDVIGFLSLNSEVF